MIGNISTNGLTPVLLAKRMKVDYERDVQVVTPLADVPVFFLATTANFPPTTFAEFIAYAREHPGKVRYGSAGIGSYQQINTEILGKRAGLDLVHIPFKGGAPSTAAVVSGEVDFAFANLTDALPQIEAGTVRGLAVTSLARSAYFPALPSVHEAVLPNFIAETWNGIMAPSKTPAPIIRKMADTLIRMADDPDTMTLVSTIISLAHSLRLKVCAEGVETEEQAKALRLLRCDEMQGYLISRPVPDSELRAVLRLGTGQTPRKDSSSPLDSRWQNAQPR